MCLAVNGEFGYNKISDSTSVDSFMNFYGTGVDFSGKVLVDVGCGIRGCLPVVLAKEKVGVDPIIGVLSGKVNFPEGKYISARAEDIPLCDDYADVVVCSNALNHFEDPRKSLKEIYRILKNDGVLLVQVYIEPKSISHTFEFTLEECRSLICEMFTPVVERVGKVPVIGGGLVVEELRNIPARYGGVFKKKLGLSVL